MPYSSPSQLRSSFLKRKDKKNDNSTDIHIIWESNCLNKEKHSELGSELPLYIYKISIFITLRLVTLITFLPADSW